MGQVIAIADFRQKKFKAKLCHFAEYHSAAIVETPTATLSAARVFCRDKFAVLIDKFGYQTTVDYKHIIAVSPMLPVDDSISQSGWQVVKREAPSPVVVAFARPRARR